MARTLIVRTHIDATARTPVKAVVHAEQCPDLADTIDSRDMAMTAPIPGESVTVRDIRNELMQRGIAYPVVAHQPCLQALADREAADDEVAMVSPTTHDLAAELGVLDFDITLSAESWVHVHGSGTAFFPRLREDAFVVRPAFAAYVREQLIDRPTTEPQQAPALAGNAPSRETADAGSISSSGTETAAEPTRAVDIPAKLLPFIERAKRYGLTVEYSGNVSRFDILHRWDIRSPNPVDETQILLHWRPGQRGGRVHISHYRGPLGKGRTSRKSIVTVTLQVARIVLDMMGESLQHHRDREAAKAAGQPTAMRQQPQQQQQAADERPATGAQIRGGVQLQDLRAGLDVQVELKSHTHTWVRIHTIDGDTDRRHAHIVVLEGKQAGQHIRHFGLHPMRRYGNYTVRIPAEPVRPPQPQTLDRRCGSLTSTHIRHELLLGPVHVLALGEKRTGTGNRTMQVSYELNLIDGWVRVREWTDESGLIWDGESTARSRVREVLDAAPSSARFIATAQLWWIKALEAVGRHRRASVQRRALNGALRHHGLALTTPTQRSPTKDTTSAEAS